MLQAPFPTRPARFVLYLRRSNTFLSPLLSFQIINNSSPQALDCRQKKTMPIFQYRIQIGFDYRN